MLNFWRKIVRFKFLKVSCLEIRKAAREDWTVTLNDLIVNTHVCVEVWFISQFVGTVSISDFTSINFQPRE
jgi:hypothetical protein